MKRVYIVDDSDSIRLKLVELLSDTDHVRVVGQAGSAEAAEEEIFQLEPDIVLLDICLPGRSGIELLRQIKQNNPGMRVVIMTNYDYPRYRRQCMQSGADLFFNKTRELESLMEELKR